MIAVMGPQTKQGVVNCQHLAGQYHLLGHSLEAHASIMRIILILEGIGKFSCVYTKWYQNTDDYLQVDIYTRTFKQQTLDRQSNTTQLISPRSALFTETSLHWIHVYFTCVHCVEDHMNITIHDTHHNGVYKT